MAANNRLEVKSKTIEVVYREYLNQDYSVNRRYQRKLVWTIEEKENLIDSILHQYPLPQFLVAETSAEQYRYEIIDGMQRLNAIFGFIENEFSLRDGRYFDLEATASTKKLLDDGELKQKQPILGREESVAVATYEIAQSVYSASNRESVEEVFRRINSTGQKLSRQDLRQAGSTSPIADLVRKISSEIRGDNSRSDILPLAHMKTISISSANSKDYGIDVDQTFWVKRGILDRTSIRSSSDEQLVLDIVSDMIFEPYLNTSTPVRNGLFQAPAPKLPNEVAEKIRQELNDPQWQSGSKVELITRQYHEVHRRVDQILGAIPPGETFQSHIGLTGSNAVPRYYETVFSAVYRIMYKEGRDLSSKDTAAELLKGANLTKLMPSGGGDWKADKKEEIIQSLTNSLLHAFNNHFEEGVVGTEPTMAITGSDFNRLLNEILHESSAIDIKQGLLPLDSTNRTLNRGSFSTIMKTLSAISNTHPNQGGRVFIGIADSPQDTERIIELDNITPLQHNSLQIVGITREAEHLGMDINKYWDTIMRKIQSCDDLPEQYRREIISKSRIAADGSPTCDHEPKYVLILNAPTTKDPVSFKGKYYERINSSTVEISDLLTFGRQFG